MKWLRQEVVSATCWFRFSFSERIGDRFVPLGVFGP